MADMTLEEALAAATVNSSTDSDILTISNDLRTITIPESIKNLGVESDEDVNRIHFKMPKMYKDVDLSGFDIRINYINGNDGDKYIVEDKTISEDYITFSWLVGRNALKTKGSTRFIVCLKKTDSEGIVQKEFNTTLASINVLEGLETTEQIMQKYSDVIEQILKKIEGSTTINPDQISEAVEEYFVNNPIEESDPTVPSWAKEETPDKTLSEEGKAADAKEVGDRLGQLSDEIDDHETRLKAVEDGNSGGSGSETGTVTATIESFTSWLAIGDSITVGYSNDNYSYADILAEKYGIYLVKDAITGTHISTDSDFGTSFANRYSENEDDFNLITVVGGINDWMHGVTLGEFVPETTGTDTFANGMNSLVRGLLEKYPNSKIVFFTSNINNNTSSNGTTNLKFEDYVDVMRTVCEYYSVPFYPLHLLCGFNGLATYDLNPNTMNTDKTHPLTSGHKKIADVITDCISFVNPSYGYGKGTLEITLKTSLIPEGASTSEIKDCLTVSVNYENGLSVELSDYTVEGSIIEGEESVLTIKYRNVSGTLTITGGSASIEYDLLYQLPQAVSVNSENMVVDLGYAPFTEASPRTIKAVFNVDNETTVGVALLRAYEDNANAFYGVGVNAVGSAKRLSVINSGGASGALMASTTSGDYLTYPNDIELFIVWDGASAVTAYVVDATGIKWNYTYNWAVTTGDGTLKFGWNHTSRYWTGTLSDLKVWGQAFTEQDVLNNI